MTITAKQPVQEKQENVKSYRLLRNQRIINSKGIPIKGKGNLVFPETEEEVALCEYMVTKGVLAKE